MVVVCKFSMGDCVCPEPRVTSIEDPKVCFDLLVDSFHFTIRLRVISSGEGEVVIEEFAKFLDEGRSKLETVI